MSQPDEMLFRIINTVKPGARVGKLSLGTQAVDTPTFFIPTARGAIPHLTSDVQKAHTKIEGRCVALEDFLEKGMAGAPIITTPLTLTQFTTTPSNQITILTPRRSPPVSTPSSNNDRSIGIITSVGFRSLNWNEYIDAGLKLQPNFLVAMSDIPTAPTDPKATPPSHLSETPSTPPTPRVGLPTFVKPGKSRTRKMADRTEKWFTALLSSFASSTVPEKPRIIAPVLPLPVEDQRHYIEVLEESKENITGGLAIYAVSYLSALPTTLTSTLPCFSFDEPTTPHDILAQIALGIDVFNLNLGTTYSDYGIALDFVFPEPGNEGVALGKRKLGTNLWGDAEDPSGERHRTDLSALSEGCSCYACRSHHRAYLRHLLDAKEMTGWVLLQIHNFHTLTNFFTAVRESISKGTFETDRARFEEVYEKKMPEKTGEGPRLRGYQFRTEPGTKPVKRNKPAYQPLKKTDSPKEGSVAGEGETEAVIDDIAADTRPDEALLSIDENADANLLVEKGFAEKEEDVLAHKKDVVVPEEKKP